MRLAIMQPYLFPYIGYYQLVAAVDQFVFLDDVNFMKRGWVNRNRLLLSGCVKYFTVPLSDVSQFHKISNVRIFQECNWQKKLSESILQSYGKAPYFKVIYPILASVLFEGEPKIAEMAKKSIVSIAQYLEFNTQFIWTSAEYDNDELPAQERILNICHKMSADHYCNLPGGAKIYEASTFLSQGICLEFVSPRQIDYRQFSDQFHPWLSIIDVLMFNDKSKVNTMLQQV
jgi:hypothetical protein